MSSSASRRAEYFMRSAERIAREITQNYGAKEFDRVVRKTHECVELWAKSKLVFIGVEPAKTHDLHSLLSPLPKPHPVNNEDLDYLTQQRIPSFYGANDFIPDEEYTVKDGERCLKIIDQLKLKWVTKTKRA